MTCGRKNGCCIDVQFLDNTIGVIIKDDYGNQIYLTEDDAENLFKELADYFVD